MIGYIVAGVVALVLLIVIGFLLYQRQRTQHLQERFGPEYDRAVASSGDAKQAEAELERREERVQRLKIRPLSGEERDRFSASWQQLQARFVDEPAEVIDEADTLIGGVMRTRGYPVGDFEERAADVSVDHPDVVTNYRAAHSIATRNQAGQASTEDLRQAIVSYRSLFTELLGAPLMSEPAQTQREEVEDIGRAEEHQLGWRRRG